MIRKAEAHRVAFEMVAERLVELLKKYGNHAPGCEVYVNGTCYCGWEELKANLLEGTK